MEMMLLLSVCFVLIHSVGFIISIEQGVLQRSNVWLIV